MKKVKFLVFITALVYSSVLFYGNISLVIAQQATDSEFTERDLEYIRRGEFFRDSEELATQCGPTTNQIPTGKNTFVIGDSLTYGKVKLGEYAEKLQAAGFPTTTVYDTDNTIDRVSGFSIEATSGISATKTKERLEQRANDTADGLTGLREASIVIIALGTNSEPGDSVTAYVDLVKYIKSINSSISIYWVNTYYDSPDRSTPYTEVNTKITQAATQASFSIIDYASKVVKGVKPNNDGTLPEGNENSAIEPDGGDGIHFSPSGYKARSSFIVKSLADAIGQPSPSLAGGGTCICSQNSNVGTLNPTIEWGVGPWGEGSEIYTSGEAEPYSLETWAIHVLKNIAKKAGVPEDTMVTQFKVIALIAWTKVEGGGVNGHVGTYNPLNTKNGDSDLEGGNQDSDGNSGTDNNSSGYPTFDKGVEAITRGFFKSTQKRIGSALLNPDLTADGLEEAIAGDFYAEPYGSTNWINRLEDIFPGDSAYATASITGYYHGSASFNNGYGDRALYLQTKRSVLERMWTPEGYIEQASKTLDGPNRQPASLKNVDASSLQFTPTVAGIPGGTDPGGCSRSGGGAVDTTGYSFPLAPQTKAVGGIKAGMTVADAYLKSTHHDETPAFDLFSTKGADVFAVVGGEIDTVNTKFKGVEGCGSIQLKGNDTFYYWYGHLRNVSVKKGDLVKAGQKIAEIADIDTYGKACVEGGEHLHIDRGCTKIIDNKPVPQRGGNDDCRDPEFIPLLSNLYSKLPEE